MIARVFTNHHEQAGIPCAATMVRDLQKIARLGARVRGELGGTGLQISAGNVSKSAYRSGSQSISTTAYASSVLAKSNPRHPSDAYDTSLFSGFFGDSSPSRVTTPEDTPYLLSIWRTNSARPSAETRADAGVSCAQRAAG